MRHLLPLALLAGSPFSHPAFASTDTDLQELRQQLNALKQQYEDRIQALETRVRLAEQQSQIAQQQTTQSAQQLNQLEQQINTTSTTRGNGFNPDISLTLQGAATSYKNDPAEYHLEGMPLGGEAGLADEGIGLLETELIASANIDNLFFGQVTLGLHSHEGETELDLEEAFIDTLSLPGGVGLRFGRFFSEIGYLNSHHSHNWDFVDAPLAYRAFLGGQYRDDGLRASWLIPTDSLLLEVGAELMRGGQYPAGESEGAMSNIQHGFINLGGDLGQQHSWQIGLSHMQVDAHERVAGSDTHNHEHEEDADINAQFTGDSRIQAIDAVWKTDLSQGRQWILQGEYFLRDEKGEILFDESGEQALLSYNGRQTGWYLQSVFKFAPHWRTGIRYDRLNAKNQLFLSQADADENGTALDADEVIEESGYASSQHDPYRWSAMLDWTPTEFSRLRLQYNRDNSTEDTDHQLFLQYIMSFGAHGAHQY